MQQTPSGQRPTTRRVRPASESKSATVRALADRQPTRRLATHYDRDARNQRLLGFGVLSLVVVVVAILAIGWLVDNVVRANDVVATIYGENVTTGQVAAEMKADLGLLQANASVPGANRAAVAAQLDRAKRALPDQELTQIIEGRIHERELARRGITVTPEEVDAKLRERIAQIAALTAPTPQPTPTVEGAATAEPTLGPLGTPTPVPTLVDSAFQEAYRKQLADLGVSDQRYREFIRRELVEQKLVEAIGSEVPAQQEQVHARHILVATAEQARAVLQRLQNGEDFAAVAAEVSTDPGSKAKGGDLGWFSRGVMNAPFETAAFGLQPGQRSDVVQSPNGYHVIEVLERDAARPVEPFTLEQLKQQAYSKWLQAEQSGQEVQRSMSADELDWLLRQVGVRP